MTRRIGRLREIADSFDAALVDQFGVLHDGRHAFHDAKECLRALARRGVPAIALSNSGKRARFNAARLERLGFDETLFRAVISSGELAHARLGEMLREGTLRPGDRIAAISRGDEAGALEGLDLRQVRPTPDARLLLIAGVEPERMSRHAYRETLAPLARSGVPALCVNPDLAIHVDGGSAFGPGAIAADYAGMGGDVATLGKPGREMFDAGLSALGNPQPSRTLMIGDSPAHDIAGARAAGCLSLLVEGGVQSGETGEPADFRMERLLY